MPRLWWVAILLATELFRVAPAEATRCRAIAGGSPALAALSAETRLAWLERRLDADAARARIWATTWGVAYGALTIGQLALLPTADTTGERAEKVVGASASFIGVLAGLALPLKVMGDQRWWARHRSRLRADADPCAALNTIELLLLRDAESEAFGVGPLVHIGNFAINVAAGLVLGLGYGRWGAFGYTTLVGIAVGELQVATQPTDAVEDLRLYRAGELTAAHPVRLGVALAPMLPPGGGGALVTLRW